ncbi:MAG: serine/threonine-protein phosphatase [Oscillospiraceae bacterium]|nr:serine/threonine-protein phosphatase [Oscillospiraceae bacterium]
MEFLPRQKHIAVDMSKLSVSMPSPVRLISYRMANMQGVGSREHQEDSFAFVNAMDVREMKRNGLFAILADGMGGMQSGQFASQNAIAFMKETFYVMNRNADIPFQLCKGVREASDKIYDSLGGNGGTTLVACVFYNERCYYVSVGDSCLYLLRNGVLIRLNREQNVLHQRYAELIRGGDIEPFRARDDPERDYLTAFLGMPELTDIDCFLRPLSLHDGDVFLICSDGIENSMTSEELALCLSRNTPEEMCRSMEQRIALQHKANQDNYTALIIQCRK